MWPIAVKTNICVNDNDSKEKKFEKDSYSELSSEVDLFMHVIIGCKTFFREYLTNALR